MPELVEAAGGVQALNERVMALLAGERAPRSPLLENSGPFWYRGYAMEAESEQCPLLSRTLKAVGAAQMVIGHTVRDSSTPTRAAHTHRTRLG